MNARSWLVNAIIGLAFLASFGCASEAPEAGDPVATSDEASSEVEVLDTFDVAGSKISFVRFGGEGSAIAISEESSAFAVGTVIPRLIDEHPELTNLEVFETLAPAGLKPSAALLESHREEALTQHRADLSPRRIAFVADVPVEKSVGTCTEFIFAGGGSWVMVQENNLKNVNGPGAFSGNSKNHVRAGICNETGAQHRTKMLAGSGGVSLPPVYEWIAAWTSKSWYYLPANVEHAVFVNAIDWRNPAPGDVWGVYHLMAGRRTN